MLQRAQGGHHQLSKAEHLLARAVGRRVPLCRGAIGSAPSCSLARVSSGAPVVRRSARTHRFPAARAAQTTRRVHRASGQEGLQEPQQEGFVAACFGYPIGDRVPPSPQSRADRSAALSSLSFFQTEKNSDIDFCPTTCSRNPFTNVSLRAGFPFVGLAKPFPKSNQPRMLLIPSNGGSEPRSKRPSSLIASMHPFVVDILQKTLLQIV